MDHPTCGILDRLAVDIVLQRCRYKSVISNEGSIVASETDPMMHVLLGLRHWCLTNSSNLRRIWPSAVSGDNVPQEFG